MFKHILVPLDGSKLAESALPVAASLALALDAPVTSYMSSKETLLTKFTATAT